MKTKSILTACITGAVMAACMIPMLAQEPNPVDRNPEEIPAIDQAAAAKRERADLTVAAQSAVATQTPEAFNVGSAAPQHRPSVNRNRNPFGSLNPDASQFGVGGIAPKATIYGTRSAFDPALAKAINESNDEVQNLIKQLKETKVDSEKEAIKEKIRKELDVQYDAYLDHHEQPLKQLEERLAKLRDEFEARKKAKVDLVKFRLDTIWYDALGLGWPSNRTTTLWRDPGRSLPGTSLYGAPTNLGLPTGFGPAPGASVVPPSRSAPASRPSGSSR